MKFIVSPHITIHNHHDSFAITYTHDELRSSLGALVISSDIHKHRIRLAIGYHMVYVFRDYTSYPSNDTTNTPCLFIGPKSKHARELKRYTDTDFKWMRDRVAEINDIMFGKI